ncbi:hypothetical protein [Dyella jiangningensis]|uniref:Uncharacterized protein n=1 Tax=Dyella jiangningensis TaxID=1379159 RepID=A0A328P2R3_9GAMM|nr:hypothetical protein [Dyella jiangningensis]RAO74464.1 hypothetical protein CA260_20530 [Dyella jiangningensis]
MKQRRAISQHAVFDSREGSPLVRPRRLGSTLLVVSGHDGFGLWLLIGLALAVGMFPDGRGDALVALGVGGLLAATGLVAAGLHSPWMPSWHGWTISRGSWPTSDALIALATLLPVMAVAGLVRGDNAFWATRLAGVALALCSLASIIITARGDARRHAPGLDERLATQLPLSRVVSATYGGGLWLWACVAGQQGADVNRHPMAWIIGLLLLALLRGLIENLRWQAVLPRMPGPRTRFELQPRRYLAALLAYAVPCLGLVLATFGRGLMPITLVAAMSCMVGMATELSLYDGALAALPDSR